MGEEGEGWGSGGGDDSVQVFKEAYRDNKLGNFSCARID